MTYKPMIPLMAVAVLWGCYNHGGLFMLLRFQEAQRHGSQHSQPVYGYNKR